MTDTKRARLAQQITCAALAMLLVLSEVFSSSLQNTLPQFSHLCRMVLTGGAAALLLVPVQQRTDNGRKSRSIHNSS